MGNTPNNFSEASFRRDIIALFTKDPDRAKGGHTSRWTYTGRPRPGHQPSGSDLWRQFVDAHDNRYYIPHMEAALIEHYLPNLAERFSHANALIDLGSGSRFAVEKKAIPLLKQCPNIEIYAPVDLSEDLLKEAEEVARELIPDRRIIPIYGDFYFRHRNGSRKSTSKQEISFPKDTARAGVMFGSTISNMNMTLEDPFPTDNIVEKIADLGYLLGKGATGPSPLTLAYDSNQDFGGSALEAYNSIHWKRMIVGLMIDVQTILKPRGNFNAFGWEHVAIPDRSKSVIHQCVRATCGQVFQLDDVNNFAVNPGDTFVVVNNIKYQPDHMAELIRAAGFTPDKPLRLPDNHMVLHTFEIPENA